MVENSSDGVDDFHTLMKYSVRSVRTIEWALRRIDADLRDIGLRPYAHYSKNPDLLDCLARAEAVYRLQRDSVVIRRFSSQRHDIRTVIGNLLNFSFFIMDRKQSFAAEYLMKIIHHSRLLQPPTEKYMGNGTPE